MPSPPETHSTTHGPTDRPTDRHPDSARRLRESRDRKRAGQLGPGSGIRCGAGGRDAQTRARRRTLTAGGEGPTSVREAQSALHPPASGRERGASAPRRAGRSAPVRGLRAVPRRSPRAQLSAPPRAAPWAPPGRQHRRPGPGSERGVRGPGRPAARARAPGCPSLSPRPEPRCTAARPAAHVASGPGVASPLPATCAPAARATRAPAGPSAGAPASPALPLPPPPSGVPVASPPPLRCLCPLRVLPCPLPLSGRPLGLGPRPPPPPVPGSPGSPSSRRPRRAENSQLPHAAPRGDTFAPPHT